MFKQILPTVTIRNIMKNSEENMQVDTMATPRAFFFLTVLPAISRNDIEGTSTKKLLLVL